MRQILSGFRYFSIFLLLIINVFSIYEPLTNNYARVKAWRNLNSCTNFGNEYFFYAVWSGEANSDKITCSWVVEANAGQDLLAISTWLKDDTLPRERLNELSPRWRQQLFTWRNNLWGNREEIISNEAPTDAAMFVAQLASWAWWHNDPDKAVKLARFALSKKPDEFVGDVLVRGISPRSNKELSSFNILRKEIAHAIPDYIFNYVDWLEIMLTYEQWSIAENICYRLENLPESHLDGRAAICRSRLAFYHGNYSEAYNLLSSIYQDLPQNPEVLTWYGLSAKQLGYFAEAEQILTNAIRYEIDSDDLVNLYWNIGDCQFAQGNRSDARESYKIALRYTTNMNHRERLLNLIEGIN